MTKRQFCTVPAVIIIEGTNERIQVVAELPVDLVLRQMVKLPVDLVLRQIGH